MAEGSDLYAEVRRAAIAGGCGQCRRLAHGRRRSLRRFLLDRSIGSGRRFRKRGFLGKGRLAGGAWRRLDRRLKGLDAGDDHFPGRRRGVRRPFGVQRKSEVVDDQFGAGVALGGIANVFVASSGGADAQHIDLPLAAQRCGFRRTGQQPRGKGRLAAAQPFHRHFESRLPGGRQMHAVEDKRAAAVFLDRARGKRPSGGHGCERPRNGAARVPAAGEFRQRVVIALNHAEAAPDQPLVQERLGRIDDERDGRRRRIVECGDDAVGGQGLGTGGGRRQEQQRRGGFDGTSQADAF